MNKATFSVLAMLMAGGLTVTADVQAHAQAHNIRAVDGIDRLQHRQQVQIRQGVRNGSLTRHETRRLVGEQRRIAALERRYRADGVLTRAERRNLRGELQHANRHIYNQTHDNDRRYWR